MPSTPKKTFEEIAEALNRLGTDPQSKEWAWIAQNMTQLIGRKESAMILSSALATRFDWITRKQWIGVLSDFPMPDVWFLQLARSPGIPTPSLQPIADVLEISEQYTLAEAFFWAQNQPATLISERLLSRIPGDVSMGKGAKELVARVRSQNTTLAKAQQLFAAFKKKLQMEL